MLKRSLLILLAGVFMAATLPVSGADAPDAKSGKSAQHSKSKSNAKKKTTKKKTTKQNKKQASKPAPKAP